MPFQGKTREHRDGTTIKTGVWVQLANNGECYIRTDVKLVGNCYSLYSHSRIYNPSYELKQVIARDTIALVIDTNFALEQRVGKNEETVIVISRDSPGLMIDLVYESLT